MRCMALGIRKFAAWLGLAAMLCGAIPAAALATAAFADDDFSLICAGHDVKAAPAKPDTGGAPHQDSLDDDCCVGCFGRTLATAPAAPAVAVVHPTGTLEYFAVLRIASDGRIYLAAQPRAPPFA